MTSDLAAEVEWKNSSGHEVVDDNNNYVTLGDPVVVGMTTSRSLIFTYLLTSQGGSYSCFSVINDPYIIKEKKWNITVKCKHLCYNNIIIIV